MNRSPLTALSVGAVAVLALAGTAWASQADHAPLTRAMAQTHAADMFARMDINHDGKLDQADRAAHDAAMFDRIDTNHDGSLSREEFAAGRPHGPEGRGAMMAQMDGPDHGTNGDAPDGDGPRGHHGHHRGASMAMMLMQMADANHDGAVTQAEMSAAMLAHFDQADTNHDGTLSAAEREAAHAAMRARMQAAPAPASAPPPAGA